MRQRIHRVVTLAALLATMGCGDSFFEVSDPDILEASNIDPEADGPTLARSAFQNLVDAYGDHIVYSAWWSHEARVGDTFPTRNEFGRRFLDDTNGTLNSEVWTPLARAARSKFWMQPFSPHFFSTYGMVTVRLASNRGDQNRSSTRTC